MTEPHTSEVAINRIRSPSQSRLTSQRALRRRLRGPECLQLLQIQGVTPTDGTGVEPIGAKNLAATIAGSESRLLRAPQC